MQFIGREGPLTIIYDSLHFAHETPRFVEPGSPKSPESTSSHGRGVHHARAGSTMPGAPLTSQAGGSSMQARGIAQFQIVGYGGVGKTQLAMEFCYRHYQRTYGFIAWLRANTEEALATDFRKLASDFSLGGAGQTLSAVVDLVHATLCRRPTAWLLVFDNVDRFDEVAQFLPRGSSMGIGHVLMTSRVSHPAWRSLSLECFHPTESLQFLKRAATASVNTPSTAQYNTVESHSIRIL